MAPKTALAAGVFCAVLAILLVVDHFWSQRHDPVTSTALTEMKAALNLSPTDEKLRKQVRALDLDLRRAHDRHLTLLRRGAWLWFGGMAVFLISVQSAYWRRKLPCPIKTPKAPGADARARNRASLAVAGVGMGVAVAAWALAQTAGTSLTVKLAQGTPPSPNAAQLAEPAPPSTPFPTLEEIQRNWPRFRGPGGAGTSFYTNVPSSWNAQSGEGVPWKSAVPGPDFNSPVVWGDRVFLTTGTAQKREVLCYDAASGKLVWQKAVQAAPGTAVEPVTLPDTSSGYAACTAAVDGRRVYASFADGEVAAFDLKGNQVWTRYFGKLENPYGHATSLELHQDRLLVQLDQGEGKEIKSKLYALETLTGKTVWETPIRPVPPSWATPMVIRAGEKDQIVTCGNPFVIAYDPANGSELWRAKVLGGEVTPSPIFAGGLVITAVDGSQLSAIKPDGSGDVTKTHVAWSADEGLPDICSPLSDGQRLYLLITYGTITCYDLKTGKKIWDKDLGAEFKASPSLAGDRIYLVDTKGKAIILAAGAEFKELGRADIGEEVIASPAFADGRIFIRGKQHLFCLGATGK